MAVEHLEGSYMFYIVVHGNARCVPFVRFFIMFWSIGLVVVPYTILQ